MKDRTSKGVKKRVKDSKGEEINRHCYYAFLRSWQIDTTFVKMEQSRRDKRLKHESPEGEGKGLSGQWYDDTYSGSVPNR